MFISSCLNILLEFNFTCSNTLESNCTDSLIQMCAKFSRTSGILFYFLQQCYSHAVIKATMSPVLWCGRHIFTQIYFPDPKDCTVLPHKATAFLSPTPNSENKNISELSLKKFVWKVYWTPTFEFPSWMIVYLSNPSSWHCDQISSELPTAFGNFPILIMSFYIASHLASCQFHVNVYCRLCSALQWLTSQ